jgi:hypothetical protein
MSTQYISVLFNFSKIYIQYIIKVTHFNSDNKIIGDEMGTQFDSWQVQELLFWPLYSDWLCGPPNLQHKRN